MLVGYRDLGWFDCYFWVTLCCCFPWLLVNNVDLDTSLVFGGLMISLVGCCLIAVV